MRSLGTHACRNSRFVMPPQIRGGLATGAPLAFVTSPDEVVTMPAVYLALRAQPRVKH